MTFQLKTLAAAVLASALPLAASANLLTNGDFESSGPVFANPGYYTVDGTPQEIAGWTVGGSSVDLIQGAYGAISGVSVDLGGTPGPGTLSQSFGATLGQQYTLSFDYFRNGTVDAALVVTFANLVPQVYNPNLLSGPATVSINWTADYTGLATVSFSTGTLSNNGPVIDNVSVTAVPEPESYAMMLAGLGALGFMARRRRQAK